MQSASVPQVLLCPDVVLPTPHIPVGPLPSMPWEGLLPPCSPGRPPTHHVPGRCQTPLLSAPCTAAFLCLPLRENETDPCLWGSWEGHRPLLLSAVGRAGTL